MSLRQQETEDLKHYLVPIIENILNDHYITITPALLFHRYHRGPSVRMKTIYIVSDSRGNGLEKLISPPSGFRIRFNIQGGATLQQLLGNAKSVINSKPCELVYILGGICSITEKIRGEISLPFETADQIYDQTKDLLRALITSLDGYDSTPVILCQMVGVDLKMANNSRSPAPVKTRKRGKVHPKQNILNSAIIKLNDYIKLLNSERGNETPELASVIHKHHGGDQGWRHNYNRLRDGVHPTETTRKFWAKRFEENIGLFLKKQ